MMRGLFVTFEGLEGVGKSTAIQHFVELIESHGIECVQTREPGGTAIAESIREVVLSHHDEPLAEETELLLMFAARTQNVKHIVRPALERGAWVICDRFTDATLAYQGYGRGIALERIYALAELAHGDLWPDQTLLMQADPDVVAERMNKRRQDNDRIESEASTFFERAGRGYKALAAESPGRFRLIDANQNLDGVIAQLESLVDALISRWRSDD